jgi:hypothetical protein
MSRQRDEDLDEYFEVSLGLSDMEKEDAEAIDGLADMLAPMSLAPPPVQELRLVPYRKPKVNIKKLNLKRLVKRNQPSKCRTSGFTHSSQSLLSLLETSTSRTSQ